MDRCTTLTLLFFGFSLGSSQVPLRTYHHVTLKLNWTEARQYCRAHYTDLATFESRDDINRLQPIFHSSGTWIGLWDDPNSWKHAMGTDRNSWRWSATGEPSKTGYGVWREGQPDFKEAKEKCVFMNQGGSWEDGICATTLSSVCFSVTNQGEKSYHFVSTEATWTSAQAYCRQHHTDLATIEDSKENAEVIASKPSTTGVWIGLYRTPWAWSDGTQSSFKFGFQPDNTHGNQFCVSEFPNYHYWNDNQCYRKLPFICHKDSELMTVMKMKIKSNKDLEDQAAKAQILQQLDEALRKMGMTDFKLRWKIEPRKEKQDSEP